MNILLTGGAGFIGSNFINYFTAKHEKINVVNLDLLTYAGNLENLKDSESRKNYTFVKGSILDRKLIEELFEKFKFDHVINFAAESHVDRSILSSEPFYMTNVIGTTTLLDVAKKFGVERFLQVSTDEVYGSLGATGKFSETTPISPNSPYSASKAAADMAVMAFYHTHGFPAVITRCSNNYGPYQFPEKLIPLMIINALNGKKLPVYGDGMNVRDWIYVLDHAKAIELVLFKGKLGEIYNVGADSEKPNIEIVKLILSNLDKTEDLIEYVKDRPGHDRRYAIDSSKIEKELGWKPEISFDEGMKATINWYLENKTWWERILNKEYLTYYEEQYGKSLEG
ncbi:MAG: dTDP-glucose 4,6-dehydratase [Melioribacteraceae bacterium]|nr:MAG: dTDP-glucose 4,6-dehydratase [Melioribacteraceae bacterium]